MALSGERGVAGPEDVNDDLKRETYFYEQALASAIVAARRLRDLGVSVRRPDDFYAEMVKSDEHMKRVRAELVFERTAQETKEERRKAREQKRYGKQVQAEKLKERTLAKKDPSNPSTSGGSAESRRGSRTTAPRAPRTGSTTNAATERRSDAEEAAEGSTEGPRRRAARRNPSRRKSLASADERGYARSRRRVASPGPGRECPVRTRLDYFGGGLFFFAFFPRPRGPANPPTRREI